MGRDTRLHVRDSLFENSNFDLFTDRNRHGVHYSVGGGLEAAPGLRIAHDEHERFAMSIVTNLFYKSTCDMSGAWAWAKSVPNMSISVSQQEPGHQGVSPPGQGMLSTPRVMQPTSG
jgi:hypothetical protein